MKKNPKRPFVPHRTQMEITGSHSIVEGKSRGRGCGRGLGTWAVRALECKKLARDKGIQGKPGGSLDLREKKGEGADKEFSFRKGGPWDV